MPKRQEPLVSLSVQLFEAKLQSNAECGVAGAAVQAHSRSLPAPRPFRDQNTGFKGHESMSRANLHFPPNHVWREWRSPSRG